MRTLPPVPYLAWNEAVRLYAWGIVGVEYESEEGEDFGVGLMFSVVKFWDGVDLRLGL